MFRHFGPRRVIVASVLAAALLTPSDAALAMPCWQPPVVGRVIEPFRAPACPYCAGNRGLDYRVGPNTSVRAVAAGVVSWAGTVAGTRYVVVRHGNGWRTTYGRLASTALGTGDRVATGSLIGSASTRFYFGLRIGEEYRDPAPHLGRLVGRPRLVPTDGTAGHRPPPPRLRCAAST